MKICFLTNVDPHNKISWSGILYQVFNALNAKHDVEWIGPEKFKGKQLFTLRFLKLLNILSRGSYFSLTLKASRFHGKNIKKKLDRKNFDFIVTLPSAELVAFLETKIPIVYISDATFNLLSNYYAYFSNLNRLQRKESNMLEQMAISKAHRLIYCSEWAANSAISHYKAPQEKVSVVNFGANLLFEPVNIHNNIATKDMSICNILFLGVDWERKGGDIAYKSYLFLKEKGLNCSFTIIGCQPKISKEINTTIIPFINKNDLNEFKELDKIFRKTHFLLLPTQSECYGIVFAEASAYGIPSISCNTGGVSAVVKEGINGYLFPTDARPEAFADKIYEIFRHKDVYKDLCYSSLFLYNKCLNWNEWGNSVNDILEEVATAAYYKKSFL